MDWVIVAGSATLGGIVGWMAWDTYVRQPTLTVIAVSAIISLMVGPAVAGIFQKIAGTTSALPREVWFYPVGLLLGASAFAAQHVYDRKREEKRQEREKDRETERQEREKDRDLIYNRIATTINSVTDQADYTMMSFVTLRDDLQKPQWDDNFFGQIIREYPHVFAYAKVLGWPGIRIIGPLKLKCPSCGADVK